MNSIKDRLSSLKNKLPKNCTLVAVSKTKPNACLLEAYNAGQRDFGENKVQELITKAGQLPQDIRWHMIGHLQRNKVKYLASFVHLIHGVDSIRLLNEIDKQAAKNERAIDCLLQIHIATEDTKFGFNEEEAKNLIQGKELAALSNIRIVGLMGMATHTENEQLVANEFQNLKKLYDWCSSNQQHANTQFSVLSSGMSGDYHIALKNGSNMVRIGSSIFGARNY